MKMKAGTCCTWASRAGGGTAQANLANAAYTGNTIELRARPELRDDDPAGSPSSAQPLPNANSNRMVDTGVLACEQRIPDGSGSPLHPRAVLGPGRVWLELGQQRRWASSRARRPAASCPSPLAAGLRVQRRLSPSGLHARPARTAPTTNASAPWPANTTASTVLTRRPC